MRPSSNARVDWVLISPVAAWASAQDQVAVIKKQLRTLLPQIKVFLDVDNLQDVKDVPRHIQESVTVMFYREWIEGYEPSCCHS